MSTAVERLTALLRRILATEPHEIDCDEFLARAAQFLESLETEREQPPELDAVVQHLDVCPECREEFEALIRATEA